MSAALPEPGPGYVAVDPADATASDEFYLAGSWHRAARVIHRGDRVEVRWPQGGAMSGPTYRLAGRVRRAAR